MAAKPYATIRPIGLNHTSSSVILSGAYVKDGENKYLLQGTRTLAGDLKRTGKTSQREELIRFGDMMTTYRIENSWSNKDEVVAFWKNHPLVQVSGEALKKNAKFILEVIEEAQLRKEKDSKSALKAMSIVSSMDSQTIKDAMYFLNRNPKDMTEMEIYLHLCDMKTGALIVDQDLRTKFIEAFGSVSTEGINRQNEMLLFVRKALAHNILEQRGGNVYFDGRLIGKSDESIIGYFLDNEDVYENLTKALEELTGTVLVKAKKTGRPAGSTKDSKVEKGNAAKNVLDELDGDK